MTYYWDERGLVNERNTSRKLEWEKLDLMSLQRLKRRCVQGSWGSCFCLLMAVGHISKSCIWPCSLWEKQDYFMVCFFWGSMEELFRANSEQKWSRSSRIAILTSKSPVMSSPVMSPPIPLLFIFLPPPFLPFSPVLWTVQPESEQMLWCMECKYMFLCWLLAIDSKCISLNSYKF